MADAVPQTPKWPYPRRRQFEASLRDAATAWFAERAYATHPKMTYCLASWDDWPKNIVLPEVAAYVSSEKLRCEREARPYPLHKYLHHGLSSQAHAFNLIGPLIVRNDLEPLRRVLVAHGVSWPTTGATACFEFEDRSVFAETSGQPTSVDIVIRDAQGEPTIFIEHKLTEPEFGGCSVYEAGDCDGRSPAHDHGLCYLHHVGRRYWEQMDRFGFSAMVDARAPCPFAMHYQFFREVLLALAKGGTFVLLSDERSPVFHVKPKHGGAPERGLMPMLLELVPVEHRSRVVSVSVQEVTAAVRESGRHGDWLETYLQKYALLR